jgi:PAS domain S-box-containing protein
MKKANANFPEAASLRQKAEELLKKNSAKMASFIEADTIKLLHELEVHQLELEMQNEELRQAIDKAATATALYDFAPAGYFTISSDGSILELNLGGAKLLGKERSNLVNSNFRLFITQDSLPVFNDFSHRVFASNSRQTCELRLSIHGNPSIYIHVEGIISEEDQKCLLTAIDVSDYKRVEKALRESEFFFKESQRAAFIGSYKTNFIRGLWESSEVLDEIFGIDKNYPRTIQGWLDITHPDDRTMMDCYLKDEVIAKRKPFNKEYRIIRKSNGETRWIIGLGESTFNDKGNIYTLIGTIQDITERKMSEEALRKSEARLSNVIEGTNVGTWEWNIQSGETVFNERWAEIIGYKLDELRPTSIKTWIDLARTDDLPEVEEQLKDVFAGTRPLYDIECRMKHHNGDWVWVHTRGKVVEWTKDSKPLRMTGTHTDITERKLGEEKMVQLNLQLKELNAAKDKFFSIIAHDLKNPFNAIIGFSNILIEQINKKDYEGITEYAGIILDSSKRAMSLLSNLFQWSRSQTGRMEFNPESIELVGLINDVIKLSNDSAQQKSITITKELPQSLNISADKAMINAILRNLISNAIKFTNKDGNIIISAQLEQNEVVVTVCDNGVGIRKDAIEKLFRIDESYTTAGTQKEKGTGLGLLLCKEFVFKHGGKIWVTSEFGKGSSFRFTIPRIL